MKKTAILLVLYTNSLDPGSALLCDVIPEDTGYYTNGNITMTANSCQPDRIFANGFDGITPTRDRNK